MYREKVKVRIAWGYPDFSGEFAARTVSGMAGDIYVAI